MTRTAIETNIRNTANLTNDRAFLAFANAYITRTAYEYGNMEAVKAYIDNAADCAVMYRLPFTHKEAKIVMCAICDIDPRKVDI